VIEALREGNMPIFRCYISLNDLPRISTLIILCRCRVKVIPPLTPPRQHLENIFE